MDLASYYQSSLDEVFEEAPSMIIDSLLDKGSAINSTDIIVLSVRIQKQWEKYKKFNVQLAITVDQAEQGDSENSIFEYDFNLDIEKIIKTGKIKSSNYVVDISGNLIRREELEKEITFDNISFLSKLTESIMFFLGINGVDVLINGTVYKTENHINSYNDMIFKKLIGIEQYEQLLNKFFLNEVQYDTLNRYFIRKKDVPKNLHGILQKNTKLLKPKPEKDFQINLEYFLKQNCTDQVLTEVHNKNEDRYDVWVSTPDNKLYVFEIKWLGKSLSAEGSIFSAYNNSDRAISGAYQLKDYIDNAAKYSYLLSETPIYCGVLLVFDAREVMDDINYPDEFSEYPQIDLKQHFKIEKDKVSASLVYKKMQKNKS